MKDVSGMLWFDNDPKTTLSEKVIVAIEYYKKKYGSAPDFCYVAKGFIVDQSTVENVSVSIDRSLLPGHMLIGCE